MKLPVTANKVSVLFEGWRQLYHLAKNQNKTKKYFWELIKLSRKLYNFSDFIPDFILDLNIYKNIFELENVKFKKSI